MSYDDVKTHAGRRYTGMPVGGHHDWDYSGGRWRETKVSPDQWAFEFGSQKKRRRAAPEGSGAAEGSMFHWFVLAHQRVRKIDADTYETFMEGSKFKIAHRRPSWRRWSSEPGARERVAEILEETARGLREQQARGARRIENQLDPRVLTDGKASLDPWLDE